MKKNSKNTAFFLIIVLLLCGCLNSCKLFKGDDCDCPKWHIEKSQPTH